MHSKLPLKSLSEMSNIRRMVLHPNIMRPLGQSFTLFEHKAFEKNAVLWDYILNNKGPNVTGTILNCYFVLQDQSTHTYNSHRYTLGKPKEMNNANDGLIPIRLKRLLSLLWVTERGDVVLFCWDWPVCHCHPAMDAETLIGKLPQLSSVLNAVSVWSLTLLDIV